MGHPTAIQLARGEVHYQACKVNNCARCTEHLKVAPRDMTILFARAMIRATKGKR